MLHGGEQYQSSKTIIIGFCCKIKLAARLYLAGRAGDVLLAALTYLIEAADEHAAPWGWCR